MTDVSQLVEAHRKVWGEAYVDELTKKTSLADIPPSTMWRVLSSYEGHLIQLMDNVGKLRDIAVTRHAHFTSALFHYLGSKPSYIIIKGTNAVRTILTLDWMYPFGRHAEADGAERSDLIRLFTVMVHKPCVNHMVGLVTKAIDKDDLNEDIIEELRLVVDDIFTEGRERVYLALNTEVGITRLCVELSNRVVDDDCFYTDMSVDEAHGYVTWLINHLNGGYFCNHCLAWVTTGMCYDTIGTLYCPRCLSGEPGSLLTR